LRTAVKAVHSGSKYFTPAAAQQLGAAIRGEVQGEERQLLVERLTPRERDVLVRVAKGLTNKEIASQLGISPRTVETHRDSVARKLKMRSVAELTRFVMETELNDD
jgi:DNA-binding NarL/FixJ family response regulator